jgi:hypothetical protein
LATLGAISMPETHFGTNPVRWKPNGGSVLHSLDNVYNDVETLKAVPAPTPDIKLSDISRNIYGGSNVMWSLQTLGYIAMPEAHFYGNVFWKPNGGSLYNLNNVYNDVETLKTNTPDFDAITSSNKFCITSTANGGTVSYITPTTASITESSANLYYTQQRVDDRINVKAGDGSLTNIVAQQIQGQAIYAQSDIRLKQDVFRLQARPTSLLEGLEPVSYRFRSAPTRRRYGFIAQDLQETHPDLVLADADGLLSVNYLDIIALLVRDNQSLRKEVRNLTDKISRLGI